MVMESVENLYVTKFRDMIHVRAQQMNARMRPYVQFIDVKPGDTAAYDGMGHVEARQIVTRFAPIQFDDIEHNRRQLSRADFTVVLPFSGYDIEGTLLNPTSRYADACVRAMERQFDRTVYAAMFATVNTGQQFQTPLTAAADGVLTVNATGGLTLAKLLEGEQNFWDAEVGNDFQMRKAIGLSGEENTTLMQIQTLTDSRFTNNTGRLDKPSANRSYLDFDIIPFGANTTIPVLQVAAGVRTSFIMAEGAIAVGMWKDWTIEIDRRKDLHDTSQVQITGTFGAVRTEGVLIQKLTTTV